MRVDPCHPGDELGVTRIRPIGGDQHGRSTAAVARSRAPGALARERRTDHGGYRRRTVGRTVLPSVRASSGVRGRGRRHSHRRQRAQRLATLVRCGERVVAVLDIVDEPGHPVVSQPLDRPHAEARVRGLEHRRAVGPQHGQQGQQHDQADDGPRAPPRSMSTTSRAARPRNERRSTCLLLMAHGHESSFDVPGHPSYVTLPNTAHAEPALKAFSSLPARDSLRRRVFLVTMN